MGRLEQSRPVRQGDRLLYRGIGANPKNADALQRRGVVWRMLHLSQNVPFSAEDGALPPDEPFRGNHKAVDNAIADFTQAIALGKKDPLLYLDRGHAFEDENGHDKAIADFTEAIRLDPKCWRRIPPEDLRGVRRVPMTKQLRCSECFGRRRQGARYDNGEYERHADQGYQASRSAIEVLSHIERVETLGLARGSTMRPLKILLLRLSSNRKAILHITNAARHWVEKGEFDKAIADFDECIRLDPNSVDGYVHRGHAWFRQAMPTRRLPTSTSHKLDPTFAEGFSRRADAWAKKHELNKAISDVNSAIVL